MSFLLAPLKAFFAWIIERLFFRVLEEIKSYLAKKSEEAKQKAIDKENLEKYKQAIEQKKTDEEISKAAEDLLNGRK